MKRNNDPVIQRFLSVCLAMLLVLPILPCGTMASGDGGEIDLTKKGVRIGVGTGTAQEKLVSELFPEAEIFYYHHLDGYAAVAQGKLDAFVFDRKQMELAIKGGLQGVRLLDTTLGEPIKIALGISNVAKIPDLERKVNSFIREAQLDGTLDDMYDRWVVRGDFSMPTIEACGAPQLCLTVGTTGIAPPYTFYEGSDLSGYDIELIYRLAAWLGADVKFEVYDYAGVVQAAQIGKVDLVAANLQVTPERAESLTFSEALYEEVTGVMVRDTAATGGAVTAGGEGDAYSSLDALAGKRIGVMQGTYFDALVSNRIPNAEISYYLSNADMLSALRTGKIDALVCEEPTLWLMRQDEDSLTAFSEYLEESQFGFVFSKSEEGSALNERFNEFLRRIKMDGTFEEINEIWFGEDESRKSLEDYTSYPDTNGTLILATVGQGAPFNYVRDGQVIGLELDFAARFCKEYGYRLEVQLMDFNGIMPSVQSGKCDFGCEGITITEERAESVGFSEPYYTSRSVLVVMNNAEGKEAFLDSVRSSFEKTFLRDARWRLFLEGVGTTLLITVLSIVFGTALGFGIYMLCRNGNPAANAVTRFFVWLVQGMPVVVLLMILYYIIFAKSSVSGTAIAVVGFTLVFGAAMYAMLCAGVGAIPKGQAEAAYALGYGNTRAFFRIILPQAVPHFLPAYKGEITALIKATAVVGYIAVQDLTKMGDIVRGRTYEAFFPLIAVAVIYFILAAVLIFLVNRVESFINPKRRRKEDILKGVETHD